MRRLPTGGRVDRSRTLTFVFDGTSYTGHPGDTLASALLANGVTRVATSIRHGRPRGVVSAGAEEPSALVAVTAPYRAPMVTATTVPLVDGLVAEGLGGRGVLTDDPDPARYDSRHVHCELLVVGAGPAGLAAALVGARAGVRVVLVDDRAAAGGSRPGAPDVWVDAAVAELTAAPRVRVLPRTTAVGAYDDGLVLAVERRTDHLGTAARPGAVRERVHRVRAAAVVAATGATERTVAFAGNDLPGVLLAGAARTYLHEHGVLVGDRVVVLACDDSGHDAARELAAAGASVVVADPRADGRSGHGHSSHGVDVRYGTVVAAALGDDRVTGVRLATVDGTDLGTLDADAVLVAGGGNPSLQLWCHAGGRAVWDDARAMMLPTGPVRGVHPAGAAAGETGVAACVASGAAAAAAALGVTAAVAAPSTPDPVRTPPHVLWSVPLPADHTGPDTRYVDLQRDATVAEVQRAVGAGLRSVEHVKRYTTIGTAHDQGRTSGVLAAGLVADALGRDLAGTGTTTARPPLVPVSFATLAGRHRGPLFDPVRTTALHEWHVAHGAVFENVGQWHRPQWFPRPGETAEQAVARETRAARTGVAIMDASTLGTIDVRGRDAGRLLDLAYTNVMSTLKPGRARYGVMCGLDGMVVDDGTVLCVGPDHYLVSTTTGNAAAVLERLEEFHQTEWPDLDVWLTSLTDHLATAAVVGPRSRDVVAAVAPGLDVSAAAFAFFDVRDAEVAGVPARVARISFSGELAFEVSVPATVARHVWDALLAAGEPFGITPYGTDAMHVLRAEKGYPIIGQDTDGTVTPHDLGLGWAVSATKQDFLGRRSFARAENQRADRKHLVALLPEDPGVLLDEGGQVLADPDVSRAPVPMLGHVTSSYRSEALGRTFALALVRSGRERIGQTLHVWSDGTGHPVTVAAPVLYDPEGARRDG